MTPSKPEDIICECFKCGKDMTDREVNEIPAEVFDPDAPVCETCRTPSQQVPAWIPVWFRVKVEWDTDESEFVVFDEDVCKSIREKVEEDEDFKNEIVSHLEGLTGKSVKDWTIVEQKHKGSVADLLAFLQTQKEKRLEEMVAAGWNGKEYPEEKEKECELCGDIVEKWWEEDGEVFCCECNSSCDGCWEGHKDECHICREMREEEEEDETE